MTPDELKALARKATPGPWRQGINHWAVPLLAVHSQDEPPKLIAELGTLEQLPVEANARLIALAPQLALLCAEMGEALEACRELFSELRLDWSDNRGPCREGQAVIAAALASLEALEKP